MNNGVGLLKEVEFDEYNNAIMEALVNQAVCLRVGFPIRRHRDKDLSANGFY